MAALEKYSISFIQAGRSISVPAGTTILEAAKSAGITLSASCGGKGRCGQCRVNILDGQISPLTQNEIEIISADDIEQGQRLACSVYPTGDVTVSMPERSLLIDPRLQVEGNGFSADIDPVIRFFNIKVTPPSLHDPSSDIKRVISQLEKEYGLSGLSVDIMALKELPVILRKNSWEISVFIRDREITGFVPLGCNPFGVAIDLGTTKIAAYLINLCTGQELSSLGAINCQAIYGDDIMSRLDSALHEPKLSLYQQSGISAAIRNQLNEMIGSLADNAHVSPDSVADICICGNTAMTHLLLDLHVEQLAKAPYVAATDMSVDIKARDAGIHVSPGAYIHIPPGIGGFVGSDHVAMILGSGIDKKNTVTLGIDIGTNTEIVISNPEEGTLTSLSCPSGPAFEGAHVTDGMKAFHGAIEAVRITEDGIKLKTIGSGPPIGLCGSGIIDTVAELVRLGLINDRGRFDTNNKRVSKGKYGSEFILSGNNNIGRKICISQKDIAQIQLAKGAIRAGIEILMDETKVTPDMVGEVVIAGAFGSYINLESAADIGLFPNFPNTRYIQAGNSALIGARMALVSGKERNRGLDIARKTKYLELTTNKCFNRKFAEGMRFPLEFRVENMQIKIRAKG
jgi:uncharacterized 2Fe-2S/4Fe-4S cluster protein (DUF4445 family)